MNATPERDAPTSDENVGPEKWVREAIAQQEEYLKRVRSCAGGDYPNPRVGMEHSWDTFSPRPGVTIEQCWRCGVTKTDEDYQRKIGNA